MYKQVCSYGIIPLRQIKGEWQTLLLKHRKGHWGFPKGHSEREEEARQTATRELEEETSLKVISFFKIPPLEESYCFHEGSDLIDKRVIYFTALVTGEVTIQIGEIEDFKWVSFQEAEDLATFPQMKRLCKQMVHHLKNQLIF